MTIVEEIKCFFVNFPKYASQPFEVKEENEYLIAKQWIKHVNKLVRRQLVKYLFLALIISIIAFCLAPIHPFLKVIISLGYVLVFCWGAIGTAIIKLYKKEIFDVKSMIAWSKAGYAIGKQIETTHINVRHEFGNTYSVKSYTENKGCLFAMIALCIRYMIFAPYCMFKGLPLTFRKYKKTLENIKAYQSAQVI